MAQSRRDTADPLTSRHKAGDLSKRPIGVVVVLHAIVTLLTQVVCTALGDAALSAYH